MLNIYQLLHDYDFNNKAHVVTVLQTVSVSYDTFNKEVQYSHCYNTRCASNRNLSILRVCLKYGKFGVKYESAL